MGKRELRSDCSRGILTLALDRRWTRLEMTRIRITTSEAGGQKRKGMTELDVLAKGLGDKPRPNSGLVTYGVSCASESLNSTVEFWGMASTVPALKPHHHWQHLYNSATQTALPVRTYAGAAIQASLPAPVPQLKEVSVVSLPPE